MTFARFNVAFFPNQWREGEKKNSWAVFVHGCQVVRKELYGRRATLLKGGREKEIVKKMALTHTRVTNISEDGSICEESVRACSVLWVQQYNREEYVSVLNYSVNYKTWCFFLVPHYPCGAPGYVPYATTPCTIERGRGSLHTYVCGYVCAQCSLSGF